MLVRSIDVRRPDSVMILGPRDALAIRGDRDLMKCVDGVERVEERVVDFWLLCERGKRDEGDEQKPAHGCQVIRLSGCPFALPTTRQPDNLTTYEGGSCISTV